MMTREEAKTATLEQLTDELAAAGWDSTQATRQEALAAVLRLLDEVDQPREQTYYAVCNSTGPISVGIDAASVDDAAELFAAMDADELFREAPADAEDDLDIDGGYMTEDEFEHAMGEHGYHVVRDLSPVHVAHAGRSDHLSGGWLLFGPTE